LNQAKPASGSDHYEAQIERKKKEHPNSDEDCGNEEVGGVVSFVATMRGGHQMALGVVCMMEFDMIPVEDAAYPVMTKTVMEQSLADRYDQMRADGS
jgi:hypothetical protein